LPLIIERRAATDRFCIYNLLHLLQRALSSLDHSQRTKSRRRRSAPLIRVAADKTILFVAEKQAALEVVKRRLERAGLGEFCLELHSDKASPKVVLESIQKRLKTAPVGAPAPQSASWHANRKEIAKYLEALHSPRPGGHTPFDLIWRALRGSAAPPEVVDAFRAVRIYEDLLIERIARAHGFQRSGDRIQRAVAKVIGKQYRRTKDDGRTVVWDEGQANR
jgi:hypothetical protein